METDAIEMADLLYTNVLKQWKNSTFMGKKRLWLKTAGRRMTSGGSSGKITYRRKAMVNMTDREREFIESLERNASVMISRREYERMKEAEKELERLKEEKKFV